MQGLADKDKGVVELRIPIAGDFYRRFVEVAIKRYSEHLAEQGKAPRTHGAITWAVRQALKAWLEEREK